MAADTQPLHTSVEDADATAFGMPMYTESPSAAPVIVIVPVPHELAASVPKVIELVPERSFRIGVPPPIESVCAATAPVELIVVVAVPPKYAVPVFEKSVVEACPSDVRPVTPSVPESVCDAPAMVPVSVGEAESTMLPVPVTAFESVTPP